MTNSLKFLERDGGGGGDLVKVSVELDAHGLRRGLGEAGGGLGQDEV